jgi:hypothetical protein
MLERVRVRVPVSPSALPAAIRVVVHQLALVAGYPRRRWLAPARARGAEPRTPAHIHYL